MGIWIKKIILHPSNIGLKQNILSCGDLVDEYDAVIVLEDDLYVAKDFYNYAKQAAYYYLNNDNIAGISLFSYKYTEIGFYQFYPFQDNYDTFLFSGHLLGGNYGPNGNGIHFEVGYR